MHAQPQREIGGQLPPLANSLHDIQKGVRHTEKFILPRMPSSMAGSREVASATAPVCSTAHRSDHSDTCLEAKPGKRRLIIPWGGGGDQYPKIHCGRHVQLAPERIEPTEPGVAAPGTLVSD